MNYRYHLFDCDGVILDSNKIKSEVFFETASLYSTEHAERATKYYKSTAGTPRIDKVYYFFEEILEIKVTDQLIEEFLKNFNKISLEKLFTCNRILGVESYLNMISLDSQSFVVSGAPQDELRKILSKQGLSTKFQEILGSPTEKANNIEYLMRKYNLSPKDCIFYGDSEVDYLSASEHGIDFIFVSEKSEFIGYQKFFINKNVMIIKNFNELI